MSYSIDVNLLLYASSERSSGYEKASRFLRECTNGSELLCLAWPTVMGYLRMATHPAIVSPPLAPDEAMRNITALLSLRNVRAIGEEEGFWDVYQTVAGTTVVRGNLVPDAHLAALLLQHGVGTLYSNDRDFLKFPFLRVKNPLQ